MNVKTLSSPYENCSNCDLKVRVSLNLQLRSIKSFKILFSAFFSSIQIQISRFACNPPMSGKEFRLIKELTYSRLTAICAFEPPFFAYLSCRSLLKDDFQSILRSLSTLMFMSLTRWNANWCYSLRTAYLIFEAHFKFFSNSFLEFYNYEGFDQVMSERIKHEASDR